jgi:hypothetical protein
MKNTKLIISKFVDNIDIDKKYKAKELTDLLSSIYDKNIGTIRLTHEKPLLIKKKMI